MPGEKPAVTFEHEGKQETIKAKVVVGADGRTSQLRTWGGFTAQRNPDMLTIAGTLMQGSDVPDDAVHLCLGPGNATLLAPLGEKRAEFISSIPVSLAVAAFPEKTKSANSSNAANQPESRLHGLAMRNASARSPNSMVLTAGFLPPLKMGLRLSAMQPHRPILPGDAAFL